MENGTVVNPEDFSRHLASSLALLSLDPSNHRAIVTGSAMDPLMQGSFYQLGTAPPPPPPQPTYTPWTHPFTGPLP